MKVLHYVLGMFIIVAMPKATLAQLEEVEASDFFDVHAGEIVYIEIADSQVLVFDSQKNDAYTLSGRPFEIRARNVRVSGDVVIQSFRTTAHGPDKLNQPDTPAPKPQGTYGPGSGDNGGKGDNGTPGTQGDTGNPGSDSATFRIFLSSISGTGTLTFDASGMKGGTGQHGGNGGNGGQGGKGHNRKYQAESPGDGGDGGDGGVGGQGGTGGKGGASGNVLFGSTICSSAQYIRMKSPPSLGGDPGIPGKGGAQGGVGPGGDGDVEGGGHGGANPGIDRKAEDGPKGTEGTNGTKGTIKCLDCDQKSVVISESTGVLECK
jgi:hypothetical protein